MTLSFRIVDRVATSSAPPLEDISSAPPLGGPADVAVAGALAPVPSSDGRCGAGGARLKFFHGPMDCGKSTLALQMDHNHSRQGRRGLLLTRHDRSGAPRITSRMGLGREAMETTDGTDLRELVRQQWVAGKRVDYLICDEAQFYTEAQVEQLADLVDDSDVDVYAFGLATDFRSDLFPAAKRLFELADDVVRLQVEVLCWCGREGHLNARVLGGDVVREGAQVVVGDTADRQIRYQVLCRRHYRAGDLGPANQPAGQLQLR